MLRYQMTQKIQGNLFEQKIEHILKDVIASKHLKVLHDPRNLKIYQKAFTAPSWDAKNNYEYLEQLGDVTANKALVWYFYRRFPPLACPEGVKVVARLKINYSSKKWFSAISEKLGFWKFILASDDDKRRQRDDLLEDTFESFIGATELIFDDECGLGVGGAVAYQFVKNVFDDMDISLKYEDLFDAKTRLKEVMDKHGNALGRIKYHETREGGSVTSADGRSVIMTTSTITLFPKSGGRPTVLGIGRKRLKADAQREASSLAIAELSRRGYSKTPPPEYAMFEQMVGQDHLITK